MRRRTPIDVPEDQNSPEHDIDDPPMGHPHGDEGMPVELVDDDGNEPGDRRPPTPPDEDEPDDPTDG